MGHELIKCEAFKRRDPAVKEILFRINSSSRGMREKALLAEKLRRDAETLLGCGGHDPAVPDCGNCREISRRRKRLAELILDRTA